MKSGNKSIRINGKSVEVTDEVYKIYTKYDRKMRYFEKDLTGDIEHNMEERICEDKNDNFPVTLLKVSHHGSDTSTSIRFLRMLEPRYAVISVGSNNRYNHPSEQTLSRLDQADVKVYRTDKDGNITVRSNGTDLDIQTSK